LPSRTSKRAHEKLKTGEQAELAKIAHVSTLKLPKPQAGPQAMIKLPNTLEATGCSCEHSQISKYSGPGIESNIQPRVELGVNLNTTHDKTNPAGVSTDNSKTKQGLKMRHVRNEISQG